MTRSDRAQSRLFDKLLEALGAEHAKVRPERTTVFITGGRLRLWQAIHRRRWSKHSCACTARMLEVLGDAFTVVFARQPRSQEGSGCSARNGRRCFRNCTGPRIRRACTCSGSARPSSPRSCLEPCMGCRLTSWRTIHLTCRAGWWGLAARFALEDLLQVHAQLPDDGLPLVLLVHHHLIPTPVTDISHIDMVGTPRLVRLAVQSVLPKLFSHAGPRRAHHDRARRGTALSALQSFERAGCCSCTGISTSRPRACCGALDASSGDLILTSAGSAGRSEGVYSHAAESRAPLALLQLGGAVRTARARRGAVLFAQAQRAAAHSSGSGARQALWFQNGKSSPARSRRAILPARVVSDESTYTLSPSHGSAERWDFVCERRVAFASGVPSFAATRTSCTRCRCSRPARIRGRTDATIAAWIFRSKGRRLTVRTTRSAAHSQRRHAVTDRAPRSSGSGSCVATAPTKRACGSRRARAMSFNRSRAPRIYDDLWSVTVRDCAPRTLLRIYWPLAAA